MIIIANRSGRLLLVVGLALGVILTLATGHLSIGVFTLAMVWLFFGWRKTDPETGGKRPFPSVFFIPLVFVAMPLALLSVGLFFVERRVSSQPTDPRAALLQADETVLSTSAASGDAALSRSIRDELVKIVDAEGANPQDYKVFTKVKPDRVLVLVDVPNLKKYKDPAREQLLDIIGLLLATDDRTIDKAIHIGIRGRLMYGAIRVPGQTKTGAVVREALLYDFYDTPTTQPATQPTTRPM